ncbi:type III-D CRISPR-associated protein Csx19 [Spirulina major]|uniref:type III-D CRISPR-associated protein Csx19 n=1 Tax=Spirulina major TaxID=270636 RepID=UPI0009321CBD|nr:CRISPR-associated protein Csx19 [Spirulina major]
MTETTSTILYSYRSDQLVTLEQAIQHCGDVLKGAIALLYSPTECYFLKVTNEEFYDSSGKFDNLNDVFEARIFTEHSELRWLNRDNGKGNAVLLSESKQSLTDFQELDSKPCEALNQKYLLWGEPVKKLDNPPGWKRLAEARIGKLDIPLDTEITGRVYLKTCEYLAEADNYGNAKVDDYGNFGVIEERLVGLEV